MQYLKSYLTGQQEGTRPSGAETVERLVDRVSSSTLLEDRRDAVRALRSLSKKFRLDVGTRALDPLVEVLKVDRNDTEIVGFALDTLCNVMSAETWDEDDASLEELPPDLGCQFTEMFIKDTENVQLLLNLLSEYDFHVRWPTVRLLTVMLGNKCKEVQEVILVSPMGVSVLMDLLTDSREVIRNDGILLLVQLTKSNANIQKIVAFENAFERLLDIIVDEGSSDGGIVVEDCLLVLLNLLKNNQSNQNFFKEGSYIQRLANYFDLSTSEDSEGWSAQKVTNIHLMIQLVRTLVSPSNPVLQISSCQKVMHKSGLLQQLCSILMASGVPADILTETINAVSEIIRGNHGNQEYFASVMAPSTPPRPAIVVLLMSMVNEKQPFVLRCAVLYCFQSFLYKNELGQSQIIQTLLPSTAEVNAVSAGQLLCGGLFSTDPLSTWLASVALLHAIIDNPVQKEQLLRVQLATSLGNPPVSLLQQCTNILALGGKAVQTRIGLLMLMCHWLTACPLAVSHFLQGSSNVPFLISQVSASDGEEGEILVQGLCAFLLGIAVLYLDQSTQTEGGYSKQSLRNILEKRIGLESFTDKLTHISKHESFVKAAQKPQITCSKPSEVLFDFEISRLFKKLENEVLRAVSSTESEVEDEKKRNLEQHESIVAHYKNLIREQDSQLNELRSELDELRRRHAAADGDLQERTQQIQQLKDQNALLKAHKDISGVANGTQVSESAEELDVLQRHLDTAKSELQIKDQLINTLKDELTVAEAKVLATGCEENNEVSDATLHQARVIIEEKSKQIESNMDNKLEMAEIAIKEKDSEIESLNKRCEELTEELMLLKTEDKTNNVNHIVSATDDNVDHTISATDNNVDQTVSIAEKAALNARVTELEEKLHLMEERNRSLADEKVALEARLQGIVGLEEQVKKLKNENQASLESRSQIEEELENSRKEQEDLLVLLADQDTRLGSYKTRLKDLGEKIEDEDELDLEGDDFEDS